MQPIGGLAIVVRILKGCEVMQTERQIILILCRYLRIAKLPKNCVTLCLQQMTFNQTGLISKSDVMGA